jgi:hypothetical protein
MSRRKPPPPVALFLLADATPMATTPDDVRDIRKVLASWSVRQYREWRQRGDVQGQPDEQQQAQGGPGGARDILTLTHDMTMESALRALSERGVLSAPIVHSQTGDYMGGFFSASDVLSKLLPELYPSGYVFERALWRTAERLEDGPTRAWCCAHAARLAIHLGTSFVEARELAHTWRLVAAPHAA